MFKLFLFVLLSLSLLSFSIYESPVIDCSPPSNESVRTFVHTPVRISGKHHAWIVKMIGMRFEPRILEVAAGDTVIWINESNFYHNVVSADGNFCSEMLKKGACFQQVFEKQGAFRYYCLPHKWMGMKGQIIAR